MTDQASASRAAMAARLAAVAGLDQAWQDAFAAVPREPFLPATVWRDEHGTAVRVDAVADPAGWRALVDDERSSIVTQLDDGAEGGPGRFTSSSSAPVVVADMLARLPTTARRVAELGTGTGWNAALLAYRYGAGNVLSVEVDPALAEAAHSALERTGYPVRVVLGDGLAEPPDGPYDALVATFAVAAVPSAWLDAVPAGRIITPFLTRWINTAILVLDVADGAAFGRFMTGFAFMHARQHRYGDTRPRHTDGGTPSAGQLDPWRVTWRHESAAFAMGLQLPGVDYWVDDTDEAFLIVWDQDGSWARIDTSRDARGLYPVRQAGPRRLWDEVEAAYRRWAQWGRPSPDRFGMAVCDYGEAWYWLDTPEQGIGAAPVVIAHRAAA